MAANTSTVGRFVPSNVNTPLDARFIVNTLEEA
jgi:hypothetical protein